MNANELQAYVYKPLPTPAWIRLVRLLPASDPQAPLECRIILVDKDLSSIMRSALVKYSAMSYVWGSAAFTHDLFVAEIHEDRYYILKITPAVDELLRRFRSSESKVNFWIDGICLDQSNETEKAEQIPRMGQIYNGAFKTRVWLGPDGDGIKEALQILEMFAEFEAATEWETKAEDFLRAIRNQATEKFSLALNQFFERRWFSRRWVLQELALSRVALVYCGPYKIAWPVMLAAMRVLGHLIRLGALSGSPLLSQQAERAIMTTMNLPSGRRMILDNLWDFHHTECSDPRDAVRALIGFSHAGTTSSSLITIGSQASRNGKAELFYEVARLFVEKGQLSHVFHHALVFGPISNDWVKHPSWLPN